LAYWLRIVVCVKPRVMRAATNWYDTIDGRKVVHHCSTATPPNACEEEGRLKKGRLRRGAK
jgi:hypothetical protein